MKLTKKLASKVLKTVDCGLSSGLGNPMPGQMCVEAAVCYALGLPHGDNPPCVSPAVRALKIVLNDSGWSSPAARARGLRRLAIAQLGSDGIDEATFATEVSKFAVSKFAAEKVVPPAAKYAAEYAKYAAEYAEYAAWYAKYAAESAEYAAKSAKYAARSAEYAAGYAKYAAEYAKSAESAAEALLFFAEGVVQILIRLKSPGTEFLYLTE